jgi:hypothetical protein
MDEAVAHILLPPSPPPTHPACCSAFRSIESIRWLYALLFSSGEKLGSSTICTHTRERRNTSWSRASLKTWWERIDVGFDQTLNKESSLSIFWFALLKREPQGEKKCQSMAPCLMRSWRLRATGTSPLYHTHTHGNKLAQHKLLCYCVVCANGKPLALWAPLLFCCFFRILIRFFDGQCDPPFKVQFTLHQCLV